MSYTDFTIEILRKSFGLSVREQVLGETIGCVELSPWLQETLDNSKGLALVSEKARSEFIVVPMLMACREILHRSFQIFSGIRLDVDPERGLKGECDFILAKTPPSPALQSPLVVILEAKKNDIEEGLGQCAAQMLAARIYNERDGQKVSTMHGCVTTGEAWQFLQLRDTNLMIDAKRYYIIEAGKILWMLTKIIEGSPEKKASDAA